MANQRVLALLEANSISGTAKAVLEMAYEAKEDSGLPGLEIVVANFVRGHQRPENSLTKAMERAQIPFSFINEKGRFDRSVLPQIRGLVEQYEARVIWTNSVKSHFLVHQDNLKKSCAWVAFHHGYTSTDFKMRLYNQMDRISLRHADRVLTVCQPFAEQMNARGVAKERIRVQHMPVRPLMVSANDSAALRNELGISADSRVILSIGRLSKEKGHSDLISAFLKLRSDEAGKRLCLLMVGDGPERTRLEQMAQGNDVRFVGHRDDASRFYGIAEIFALPSYTEGTPNVLLEAMSAGVPIVATNVGGIPELAVNGRDAVLVPPSQPAELASALRRLLESADFRNELIRQARTVVAAHTPRAYFEGMKQVFWEAAAR